MNGSIAVRGMVVAVLASAACAADGPASAPAGAVVPPGVIRPRIGPVPLAGRARPIAAPATGPTSAAAPDANSPAVMPATVPADANAPAGGIQLSLPPTMTVGLLIEYVSKRMGLNIIYDEEVGRGRVAISSPTAIPQSALIDLLKDALKMSELELIDTGIAGWKTIGRKAVVKLVSVKNVDADSLSTRVTAILAERQRIMASARTPAQMMRAGMTTASRVADVTLVADKRSNQIAVVATAAAMKEALALLETMDVAGGAETRTYRFTNIQPERVDKLIREHVAGIDPRPAYSGTVDPPSNMLIATTTLEVHRQIDKLKKELDVEGDTTRPRLQFYKLANTTADEVLATIRQLYGEASKQQDSSGAFTPPGRQTSISGLLGESFTGPNKPPTPMAGGETPNPPVYHPSRFLPPAASQPSGGGGQATVKTQAPEAVVTADKNTNSIIVVATPDVQAIYRQLIEALDKRRPQVLVEVTLVSLNTTNNLSYGVELGYSDVDKNHSTLVFNSFGLSTIDPKAGITALAPGTGFNGILLNPDSVTAVVQALASDSGSRIMSAPRVLVNDNATGTLASVAEEPFTSVNASDTVSTTSFAGYASAGTTITVTPHISEDDYLQLKYGVTVNSFTGTTGSSSGIPPPRQTDTVTSEITVPNGYAVVVGGLTQTTKSLTETKTPWLGDIPILGYAFGLRSHVDNKSTLFVFIRPVILRDDKFQDLKNLSREDLLRAEIPTIYPASEPVIIR